MRIIREHFAACVARATTTHSTRQLFDAMAAAVAPPPSIEELLAQMRVLEALSGIPIPFLQRTTSTTSAAASYTHRITRRELSIAVGVLANEALLPDYALRAAIRRSVGGATNLEAASPVTSLIRVGPLAERPIEIQLAGPPSLSTL